VPAAAERWSEFSGESHGGLTRDDERGEARKSKSLRVINITVVSVVKLLGTIVTIIVI
jgi:hypothetical protein